MRLTVSPGRGRPIRTEPSGWMWFSRIASTARSVMPIKAGDRPVSHAFGCGDSEEAESVPQGARGELAQREPVAADRFAGSEHVACLVEGCEVTRQVIEIAAQPVWFQRVADLGQGAAVGVQFQASARSAGSRETVGLMATSRLPALRRIDRMRVCAYWRYTPVLPVKDTMRSTSKT